jgi:hypothetical protein
VQCLSRPAGGVALARSGTGASGETEVGQAVDSYGREPAICSWPPCDCPGVPRARIRSCRFARLVSTTIDREEEGCASSRWTSTATSASQTGRKPADSSRAARQEANRALSTGPTDRNRPGGDTPPPAVWVESQPAFDFRDNRKPAFCGLFCRSRRGLEPRTPGPQLCRNRVAQSQPAWLRHIG